MKEELINWIGTALQAFNSSNERIIWNLFLAYIPLLFSIWLFRTSRSRSLLWWLGFFVFIAFLPNAPYILTDTIHLIELIRQGYSPYIVTLVLIPQYFCFIGAGVEAYTISLMQLSSYIERQGYKRSTFLVELIVHALCSIGIYLGRFERLNSWNIITHPETLLRILLDNLTGLWSVFVMGVIFIVLIVVYSFVKQINLAIALRIKYLNLEKRREDK